MYFAIKPRTRVKTKQEFGVFDAVKDENGSYKSFETIDEAKAYITNELNDYADVYWIIDLVG